jgi:hypothetical protein
VSASLIIVADDRGKLQRIEPPQRFIDGDMLLRLAGGEIGESKARGV